MSRSLWVEQDPVITPSRDVVWTEVRGSMDCLKRGGPWMLGDWQDTPLGQTCLLC